MLLALLRLDGTAYTVPVVEEIEAVTGRAPSPAAVYTTLRRLEARAMVSSRYDVPADTGRRVRLFTLERAGVLALRTSRRTLRLFWRDVDGLDPG